MIFCQVLKFIIISIKRKEVNWNILYSTGGFPSSHSGLCMSLVTSLLLFQLNDIGMLDWSFVVALIFSIIVIHDAMGVRLEASKHAKILNNFNKLFKAEFVADGTINAESMKRDGKASKDDIFITSCMEFGTVNIDKLLKCNDFKLIKYAFENYPISFQEMLLSLKLFPTQR
jgi:acid phosphatase family membrane protein YuiD